MFLNQKSMNSLTYDTGIEYLFQYLRPKELVVFASMNKFSLSLVQGYFAPQKMLSLQADGTSIQFNLPKKILFKVTLGVTCIPIINSPSRSVRGSNTFIFRPISVHDHQIYGWIISGNGMLKTGGHFKPYPWCLRITIPYAELEPEKIHEFEISKCAPIVQILGQNTRLNFA